MKQYYNTLLLSYENIIVSVEKQLLYLFFLLLSGYSLYHFSNFSPSPNNNNYNNIPKVTALASCAAPLNVEGSIESKAHTGSNVTLPVGTNINGLKKWSVASSWNANTKPGVGDDVLIPANSIIVLDQNINVKSITVKGKLIIDLSKDISVSTEYIILDGSDAYFEWGTESNPYTKKGVVTLRGSNKNTKIPGTSINYKAIVAGNNSNIELHGNTKTSWTRLSANARPNQNKITVIDNASNWAVGDQILIVSSRLNWKESEKRTITAISADKKTFTLNSNLRFPHIGRKKSYTRSKDGKVWDAEIRAEVGLLSKSIKIQGDAGSVDNQFGGHIMIHTGAQAHVNSVELFRMGQKSIIGRYPFHWHLLQERGAGQYLKNSSIHTSYNRAITIHGTESTLVENNFAYDHIGHGVFLEDGSERFNVIKKNVVALSKRPKAGEEVTPSDNQFNEVQNRTPSQFWITNPNNIFEDNVAAGTEGTGFWFAMPKKPMQQSANIARFRNLQPHKEKLGKFSGNVSHSCKSGFDIFDQLTANHSIARNSGWERTDKRYIDKHIFYANDLANYGGIGGGRKFTEGVVFRDNIYTDNKTALMYASYPTVENSVFIAKSGENIFNGERKLNRGYDGSITLKNCHLVGWNDSEANYVQNTGGAQKHVNYRISGTTLSPDTSVRMSFPNYNTIPKGNVGSNAVAHPRFWSYVHWDIDGSISGKANTSIVTNHPLCRDGSEVRYSNWTNLYRTDRRFAYTMIDAAGDPKMTVVRTKTGTPKAGLYYINGFYGSFIHFPVMVNDGFLYTLQFESLGTGKKVAIRMRDIYTNGDTVLFRIKEFGKLPGLSITNSRKLNSLDEVRNENANCYAKVGDDIYLKMVAKDNPDFSSNITWTSDIRLAVLDTDGDGITDKQESIDGTDPIPNDRIPTNPVIPWEQVATVPNRIPEVSFANPTNLNVLEGYQELYIKADVNAFDGATVSNVKFFINNQEIRQESVAPYEWGHNGSPMTSETLGLPAGQHELKLVVKDSRGDTAQATVTLNVETPTLSLGDIDASSTLRASIFPNPTKANASLQIDGDLVNKASYTIVDISGKTILSKSINSKTTALNIESFSAGVYFVIISNQASKRVIKLVKN